MSRTSEQHQGTVSRAPTHSLPKMVCHAADQTDCWLCTAAVGASRRKGPRDSLTRCESEIFLTLASGDRIAVKDHETGAFCLGQVDMTFPEHGFVWIITDLGERKLLDISVQSVWPTDGSRACGLVRRDADSGSGSWN